MRWITYSLIPECKVNDIVKEGDTIGYVTPVLKEDKRKVPSTSMLHLELYNNYNGKWVEWTLDKPKPNNLEDPTKLLDGASIH